MILSAYASARDAAKTDEDAVAKVVSNLASFTADASWWRSARETMDAFTAFSNELSPKGRAKKTQNYLARLTLSTVPLIGLQRSVFEKGMDDKVRHQPSGSFGEILRQNIPMNYTERKPVLNWDGSEVTRPGNALTRPMDPFRTMKHPGGVTAKIQATAGDEAVPGMIDPQDKLKVGNRTVSFSEEEQYKMRKQKGQRRAKKIGALIKTDEFKNADKAKRGELIKEAQKEATREVHDEWRQKKKAK
jgi:hypothetical protein